jgi:hypothetical protein
MKESATDMEETRSEGSDVNLNIDAVIPKGHYGKARKAVDSSLDCLIREENEIIASSYATSGDANDPQL